MARSSVLGNATRVEPQPADQEAAEEVTAAVGDATDLRLLLPDGGEIALPESLVEVLRASAGELSAGHAVTVLASDVRLSPTEVGTLLGLSRPFVARLLDSGDIPSQHLPGSRHRVIRLADVLRFQARREKRRTGRRRVAAEVDTADLPY